MRCDQLSHVLSVMQLPHRTSDWAPDPKVEEEGRQEHAHTYLAASRPPRWPVSANEHDPREDADLLFALPGRAGQVTW